MSISSNLWLLCLLNGKVLDCFLKWFILFGRFVEHNLACGKFNGICLRPDVVTIKRRSRTNSRLAFHPQTNVGSFQDPTDCIETLANVCFLTWTGATHGCMHVTLPKRLTLKWTTVPVAFGLVDTLLPRWTLSWQPALRLTHWTHSSCCHADVTLTENGKDLISDVQAVANCISYHTHRGGWLVIVVAEQHRNTGAKVVLEWEDVAS